VVTIGPDAEHESSPTQAPYLSMLSAPDPSPERGARIPPQEGLDVLFANLDP
jgi:hypothetical protein